MSNKYLEGEGSEGGEEKKEDAKEEGEHLKSKMGKRVVAGRYHPGRELGKGMFSKVYSAVDSVTGSLVAIKKVETGYLSPRDLERIRQELSLLKRLIHPNIVSLMDFEETSKNFNFVLEYVEGGSLHDIKTKFGTIPEPLLAIYMRQTLKGLHHLHSFNIVHRDIKGANILCTKSGECKLADFGSCSESLREDYKMTMIGTPYWMAPELISQTGGSIASDVWSLGCTVLELFTGQPPYWKVNQNLALLRMVEDAHPPLPESTASELLIDFLLNCFLKDAKMRYTAQELLQHEWIVSHSKSVQPTTFRASNITRSKTPPPAITTTSFSTTHKSPGGKSHNVKKSKKGFLKKKEKPRPVEEDAPSEQTESGDGVAVGSSLEDSTQSQSTDSSFGNEGTPSSPASLVVSPPSPSSSSPALPASSFPSIERKESDSLELRRINEGKKGSSKDVERSNSGKTPKHNENEGPAILNQIEAEFQTEIDTLQSDVDEWERKLLELVHEREELESQNDGLRAETEDLLKKKETLDAKRDYLKDLIARQERGDTDLLEVDLTAILKRFQSEMAHTQREVEMAHAPKMSSVCWLGPGAICQCRDSGTHKWDAAVITGNEISGSDLLFNVIFLGSGEKDQVRASDLQPPRDDSDENRRKKKGFSFSKKKEKGIKH